MSIFEDLEITGKYPKELDEEKVYKIGRVFIIALKVKEVVVGRDEDAPSDTFFRALMRGITDEGANVIDIGFVKTPVLHFGILNYGHDSGIMIAAQNNLRTLTFYKEKACPADSSCLKEIERIFIEDTFSEIKNKGGVVIKNVTADYERQSKNEEAKNNKNKE